MQRDSPAKTPSKPADGHHTGDTANNCLRITTAFHTIMQATLLTGATEILYLPGSYIVPICTRPLFNSLLAKRHSTLRNPTFFRDSTLN